MPAIDVADSLNEILDLATEVLYEYAPDQGRTRIERLSRWLLENLGRADDLQKTEVGKLAMLEGDDWMVVVAGDRIRADMPAPGAVDAEEARAMAAALICAAELAER